MVFRKPWLILCWNKSVSTKFYDKRYAVNFPIVNIPFICSNIPITLTNGIYVSQLIHNIVFPICISLLERLLLPIKKAPLPRVPIGKFEVTTSKFVKVVIMKSLTLTDCMFHGFYVDIRDVAKNVKTCR
jgi:hypothetical protein